MGPIPILGGMGRAKTIEDDDLLAIARAVLRKRGHTATIRQVAKAAGISPGVLYQRYRNKEELFLAALAPTVPAVADDDPGDDSPQVFLERFAAKVKDHFTAAMPAILLLATHPRFSKKLIGQVHHHNRAGEIAAMLILRLEHWQRLGQVHLPDPAAFAAVFIHTLHSMALRDLLAGESKPKTAPKEMRPIVQAWWEGLGPR